MYIQNGPSIHVTFTVTQKEIRSIELSKHASKGLTWVINTNGAMKDQIEEWLLSYCRKLPPKKFPPLLLDGLPPFTRHVLESLSTIPFGQASSYKEVAVLVGKPKAARAVGQACGRNPFPLILPCHRVLAADNRLGGFSCGLAIKENLLAFEDIATI